MEYKEIDLGTLESLLTQLIERTKQERAVTAGIYELLMNTGLRIGEALTVERWQRADRGTWNVAVQKAEAHRQIPDRAIPNVIRWHYEQQQPFLFESYSSVNNTFRRLGPVIIFNDKGRPSTNHAFRYYYIKKLAAQGLSERAIQQDVGHVSAASTAGYVGGKMWAWVDDAGEIGTGTQYEAQYLPTDEAAAPPILTPDQYAEWYKQQQRP